MIHYEITKKIAVLGGEAGANTKELNLVKWGCYEPAFDIRRWERGAPRKGITLNREEAELLLKYLKKELEGEENG